MDWKKTLLQLATLSLTLTMGLLIVPRPNAKVQAQQRQNPPVQRIAGSWEISQAFRSPDRGAPTSTAGGASRGSQCRNDADSNLSLTALMPPDNFGLTATTNPKLFFYIPATSARRVEFVLRDDRDLDVVYRKSFTITGTAGIVSFSPLEGPDAPPLAKDKSYRWFLALRCNVGDPINDPFVQGWLQITELDPTLADRIQSATDSDRLALYAKNGIWYQALTTVAELRRNEPNSPAALASWQELLGSVGLEKLVKEPLIDCCTSTRTSALQ